MPIKYQGGAQAATSSSPRKQYLEKRIEELAENPNFKCVVEDYVEIDSRINQRKYFFTYGKNQFVIIYDNNKKSIEYGSYKDHTASITPQILVPRNQYQVIIDNCLVNMTNTLGLTNNIEYQGALAPAKARSTNKAFLQQEIQKYLNSNPNVRCTAEVQTELEDIIIVYNFTDKSGKNLKNICYNNSMKTITYNNKEIPLTSRNYKEEILSIINQYPKHVSYSQDDKLRFYKQKTQEMTEKHADSYLSSQKDIPALNRGNNKIN